MINDENNGWGEKGLDLNSGWNWTPINQGWFFNSIISGSVPSGDNAEKISPFFSISILYFIDKDDYSKKYETQISISNPSRMNQITKFISKALESNKELLSIIKSTISWEEKTRILNENLDKLVLLEFNKDYSIKFILIEKYI